MLAQKTFLLRFFCLQEKKDGLDNPAFVRNDEKNLENGGPKKEAAVVS